MPKISIFVLNSSESWGKRVSYKRVNRNTKSQPPTIDNPNGSRDAFHIQHFGSAFAIWLVKN